MNMGKETVKPKGWALLLDDFRFVGICRCNGIRNSRGVFKLKYN
jgi:hypothetical protein